MTQALVNAMREEKIEGSEGAKLFIRSWRPSGTVRAVVMIVPGFNSHSGYYGWVAEQLVSAAWPCTRWICAGVDNPTASGSSSRTCRTT